MAAEEQTTGLTAQRASFSAWIGVVLLFLVFGFFVLIAVGAGPRRDAFEKKRAQNRLDKLKASRAESVKALTSYAWIDKDKHTARIPITDAMHIMYTELQKPPAPAGPITPESQAGGTQSTAPATAPPSLPAPTGAPSATPVSKGGHESESGGQNAAGLKPAPVAPGTQPGVSATPAAPPPPPSGQPNPAGPAPSQATATPHGSPLPVPGKTP
ncbi:MAG: hypothetical protein ACJ8KU_06425 [Chthoniobacterales bacterium]